MLSKCHITIKQFVYLMLRNVNLKKGLMKFHVKFDVLSPSHISHPTISLLSPFFIRKENSPEKKFHIHFVNYAKFLCINTIQNYVIIYHINTIWNYATWSCINTSGELVDEGYSTIIWHYYDTTLTLLFNIMNLSWK